MIKTITIDFPDNFTPPEKFDYRVCFRCPLYWCNESDIGEGCCLQDYENFNYDKSKQPGLDCPIKKYFD